MIVRNVKGNNDGREDGKVKHVEVGNVRSLNGVCMTVVMVMVILLMVMVQNNEQTEQTEKKLY